MIAVVMEFSRYLFAMLFGAAVAVSFAGMARTRKNYMALGGFTVISLILQFICLRILDMDMTIKIYPLISDLPVTIFIVVYL